MDDRLRDAARALGGVLAGHEQAFQHFGGVPDSIVIDNLKAAVLAHTAEQIVWHPVYADFAAYYGFRPWAHWPYRPETKGKVESGVKYVKRNALAGKRFGSWTHLNAWLLEWATTIADTRVHGIDLSPVPPTVSKAPAAGRVPWALSREADYQWRHLPLRTTATLPVEDGVWSIYFCNVLVAHFDERDHVIRS